MTERFRVIAPRRGRRIRRGRPPALAHDPDDARDRVVRDQRVAGDRGRPGDHRRARRARRRRRRARGAVPRARRASHVHDRRRAHRSAGRFARLRQGSPERGEAPSPTRPRRRSSSSAGGPGSAFTVSPWERSAEALRFWTTGEWDRAIDVLSAQLAEDPGNANVLYNLACAESRGGRSDACARRISSRRSSGSPASRGTRRAIPTSTRSAATSAFRQLRALDGLTRSGVAREPERPRRSSRNAGHRVVLGPRDEQHRPMLRAGERSDEELEADGERERLVGARATERHELLGSRRGPRARRRGSPRPSRRRRRSVAPALDGMAIASGFVPVRARDAVGVGESRRRGRGEQRDQPRPLGERAAPSSRARPSGSSASRRRALPTPGARR